MNAGDTGEAGHFGDLLRRRLAATSYHAGLLVGITLGRNSPLSAASVAEAEAELVESARLVDDWLAESSTSARAAIERIREVLDAHAGDPLPGLGKLREYVERRGRR